MLLSMWLSIATAQEPTDPMLDLLAAEIDRAMTELADEDAPPFFLSAEVVATNSLVVSAEDGALHDYAPVQRRWLDIDVRIGSPELDSTHRLRSERNRRESTGRSLPIGEDAGLVRRALWREIDERYRSAKERWSKVQSDDAILVSEDAGLDLVPVEPVVAIHDLAVLDIDPTPWEDRLRKASAVLARDDVVRDGSVRLSGSAENRWFVSSEGTRLRHGHVEYMAMATVDTIADDGAEIRLSRRWMGRDPDVLPNDEDLASRTGELHDLLALLRVAPELEPYTGPAILTERAAGVFFHEVFGHRIEGYRLKHIDNAQTFKSKVGEQILPEFLTIVDDPTLRKHRETDLRGHYLYDNEGVPSERTVVVDKGVLKGFLESRSTSDTDVVSNGHGRRQSGKHAVTRQGNLIVTAEGSVSNAELRKELLSEARRQDLDYALVVEDIQGGFTNTGRGSANSFTVKVLVARKIFVDGRPDEYVRGVDLIGTPLIAFSRIAASGESNEVFNGSCGAESGWVPISQVAPAILLNQVETQKKAKPQTTPPLLPAPMAAKEGA